MLRHANQTSFKKGHRTWIEGKHHSESTKRKLKLKAMEPERIAQSIANLPPTGKGSENPNWRGGLKTKTCLYCGAAFQVIPAIFDKAKYCSRECKDRALNINKELNPNWRGGYCKNCEYCGAEFWVQPSNERTHRYCSLSCKAKTEGIFKRLNNNPEFQQKRLKAAIKQPNRQERKLGAILEKWFPSDWRFVGDGEVILGKLNPDFINCNGKKQIIEFFGCWWHGCPLHHKDNEVPWQDTEVGRKVIYSRYGFKTLVIWEHELGNEEELTSKIRSFAMARALTKERL